MASVKEFYKVKLLAAKDIKGKTIRGVITAVYPETMHDKERGDSTKLVVELGDGEHRIQLNKTNAIALAKMAGDDTDEWVGKTLEIKTGPTVFQGKPTEGLVLRIIAKK